MVANVSWGIAGASAIAAGYLLTSAMVEDARAASPPEPLQRSGPPIAAGAVPLAGGAMVTLGGTF
jgi:hypothetical protein